MFSFLKAAILGAVLAFVVAAIIGHAGSSGGLLNVRHMTIEGFRFYWSWGLFVIGIGLAWGILLLLE
jgi:hypothetical protein